MRIKTSKLTRLALMASLAIASIILLRIPLMGPFSFLVYDMADVIIILSAMLYGNWASVIVLFIVSAFQSLFLNFDGLIGFFMHFLASLVMVISLNCIYKIQQRKYENFLKSFSIAAITGVVAMSFFMLPINFFVIKYIYPLKVDYNTLLIVIFCFNMIKGGANCALAALSYKFLKPTIEYTNNL